MTPLDLLLSRLPSAKKVSNGWVARCPAHDDRYPSLSLSIIGEDDRVLLHCHAGCSTEAVLAAVGLEMRDLFPPKDSPTRSNGKPASNGQTFATAEEAVAALERQLGPRSALWTYRDAQGKLVGVVVRWDGPDGKDIRPVARHGDGWRIAAMAEPRPLYRLPEVRNAKRVIVTEGEKCADAARSLGFVATTSPGGAQAAHKTDWQPLAGKEVWILPDNDLPGRQYAETVAGILSQLTPKPVVRIVELPELPEHGDIVDWIENLHGDAAEPDGMRAEIEALTREAEPWRPVDADALAYRPFPVDALPEPLRGFTDTAARAIGCDPSYVALPLLTACAAAIGNTRRLELKRGWIVPPILWAVVIGESGTAKTAALQLALKPVRERQRLALERHAEAVKQYKADRLCWEREMLAWKKRGQGLPPAEPEEPAAERLLVSDTTVEALAPILLANPRGLLLIRDELSAWIGSFDRYAAHSRAKTDGANWLSMFNADAVIVDRKTGASRTLHVPRAAVCVCGGIQPAILQRVLGREHRESGLAARLLLTCPPRKAKRWTEADIDPGAEAELVWLFDTLYGLQPATGEDGKPQPVLVRLSGDAKMDWIDYYNAHAVEHTDLTGDLAAAWSKLEEYAARLALVIHYVRWAAGDLADETRLDARSMKAGITLANWFKHEARRVYAMLDESEGERNQRRLVEWIERRGGCVTAREVQRGCRWLCESGAAEEALEELVKAGRGVWEQSPAAQRGQPTRRFRLLTASTRRHVDSIPGSPWDARLAVDSNRVFPVENRNTVDVDSVGTQPTPWQYCRQA